MTKRTSPTARARYTSDGSRVRMGGPKATLARGLYVMSKPGGREFRDIAVIIVLRAWTFAAPREFPGKNSRRAALPTAQIHATIAIGRRPTIARRRARRRLRFSRACRSDPG